MSVTMWKDLVVDKVLLKVTVIDPSAFCPRCIRGRSGAESRCRLRVLERLALMVCFVM